MGTSRGATIPLILAGGSGVVGILAGGLTMLGWWFGVELLRTGFPHERSMNPFTALCFILLGLALYQSRDASRASAKLPRYLAALVPFVVVARVASEALGWGPTVDQWIAGDPGTAAIIPMGSNTAVGLIFASIALLLQDFHIHRGVRPAEYLALFTGFIGLLGLAGHAYGTESFSGLMAPNSAVAMAFLGIGMLSARPERGLVALFGSSGPGGTVMRWLLPTAVGAVVVMGWLRWKAESAGYFDNRFGLALFTVTMIVLLTLLVWGSANFLEKADAKRRRAEEEVAQFFGISLELLCIADFSGYFRKLNPAWEKALGWTREELLKRPFMEMVHPEDREATARESERIARGEQILQFENRYLCKDGSHRWLLWNASPLPERGLIFAVARDITERKQAEQLLRQRTADLEVTNRELEAFCYSVSHDLRAPLRGIDGFSQAILEDYEKALDSRGQDYLRRVCAATQRMASLIDDLLNLSRVTRAEFQREQVALSPMAESIAEELRRHNPNRQVETIIAPDLEVEGDPRLLRLVLENLLSNAWKFTGRHERARVEFGCNQQNGSPIFFVRDDGAGFDAAYVHRLFGPFQRLHSGAEFPGTGVGLATVQRIVQRHGGRVWAESEVEKGATFYFTLDPPE